MSKIVWDATGNRKFHTGVDHVVLYPQENSAYPNGVAWNGFTSISESPEGAEAKDIWADNMKYAVLRSVETLKGTLKAYMYPDEWEECDGSAELVPGVMIRQQTRKAFGLCYRTMKGSDTDTNATSYILHLVYGATASPSEQEHATVNDSPDAMEFSWEFTTVPVNVTGHKSTSTVEIDSETCPADKLAAIEKVLFGDESTEARLPLPDEIYNLLKA